MAYSLMMTSFDNSAVVEPHVKSVTKRASYGGETLGEIHRMRRFRIKFHGFARRRCERGGLRGFRIRARAARRASRVRGGLERRNRNRRRGDSAKVRPASLVGSGSARARRAGGARPARQRGAPRTRIASHHAHVVPCQFRCANGTYIHHPFFIDELIRAPPRRRGERRRDARARVAARFSVGISRRAV